MSRVDRPVMQQRRSYLVTAPIVPLHEVLAAEVREGLTAADMSQADAADFVGISEKHLSQMLNGKVSGSVNMWDRLLRFVDRRPCTDPAHLAAVLVEREAAVVQAAKAEAWDEGERAGWEFRRTGNVPVNPYRTAPSTEGQPS